jgi:hypothetical protein
MEKKKEIKAQLVSMDIEGNLEDFIGYLRDKEKEYRSQGYIKFYIEKNSYWEYDGSDITDFYLCGIRLETDIEFNKRIEEKKKRAKAARKAAKTRAERKEERELENYKKLHAKYKGKV